MNTTSASLQRLLNAKVYSGYCNLREEFQKAYHIPFQCKERILSELNALNINLSTLFPETESQLKHINFIYHKLYSKPSFYLINSDYCIVRDLLHYVGRNCPIEVDFKKKYIQVNSSGYASYTLFHSPEEIEIKINEPDIIKKQDEHIKSIFLKELPLYSADDWKIQYLISELRTNNSYNSNENIKKQENVIIRSLDTSDYYSGYSEEIKKRKAENIVLNAVTALKSVPITYQRRND